MREVSGFFGNVTSHKRVRSPCVTCFCQGGRNAREPGGARGRRRGQADARSDSLLNLPSSVGFALPPNIREVELDGVKVGSS